jgi:hypothetical protein
MEPLVPICACRLTRRLNGKKKTNEKLFFFCNSGCFKSFFSFFLFLFCSSFLIIPSASRRLLREETHEILEERDYQGTRVHGGEDRLYNLELLDHHSKTAVPPPTWNFPSSTSGHRTGSGGGMEGENSPMKLLYSRKPPSFSLPSSSSGGERGVLKTLSRSSSNYPATTTSSSNTMTMVSEGRKQSSNSSSAYQKRTTTTSTTVHSMKKKSLLSEEHDQDEEGEEDDDELIVVRDKKNNNHNM